MNLIFYVTLGIFVALFGALYNDIDYDYWARLIVGKSYFQTGTLFNNDFYSYGTTHEFIDHEWGSSLVFYLVQNYLGDVGAYFFKIIIIFLTWLLLIKAIQIDKKDVKLHFLFFFFAIQSIGINIFHVIRCQTFTFFFFALFLYILKYVRETKKYRLLWCLPVLNVVWANLHGGFVMGLALIGLFIVGEFLNNNKKYSKYLLITFVSTFLTSFINPYGYKYIAFIFDAFKLNRVHITEWQSAFFFKPFTFQLIKFKFYFVIANLIFIISIIKNIIKTKSIIEFYKKIDKTKYLIILFTALISLKALRCHVFFTYCVVAFCYCDFYKIFNKQLPKVVDNAKEIVILILVIIMTFARFYFYRFVNTIPNSKIPVYMTEIVRQNNLKGNVFTSFHFGSYVAYKLYPNNFVYMDGRYEEVYDNELINKMQKFLLVKDNQKLLDEFHTDIIILENFYPAKKVLDNSKNWKLITEDELYSLYFSSKYKHKKIIFPRRDFDNFNKTKFETSIDWQK